MTVVAILQEAMDVGLHGTGATTSGQQASWMQTVAAARCLGIRCSRLSGGGGRRQLQEQRRWKGSTGAAQEQRLQRGRRMAGRWEEIGAVLAERRRAGGGEERVKAGVSSWTKLMARGWRPSSAGEAAVADVLPVVVCILSFRNQAALSGGTGMDGGWKSGEQRAEERRTAEWVGEEQSAGRAMSRYRLREREEVDEEPACCSKKRPIQAWILAIFF
ncbi:hypothetical protein BRADI_5g18550v3 [Brachypodium distachyon]|uniref:Uncharacterized protein n=1 Tax=Brachypodium distachyon TaxID=15368 RepID=A0A0Q3P5H0_BRADI|nr:hypothetical protein BRADI_5g18550v3 [Brachypodium distachyon]